MKKIYYAGIDLQKDLEFIDIIEQLKKDNEIVIKNIPENFEVVEMEYIDGYSNKRKETGKTHIGYYYHYVLFEY